MSELEMLRQRLKACENLNHSRFEDIKMLTTTVADLQNQIFKMRRGGMTPIELENLIEKTINESQGLKAVELVIKVLEHSIPEHFDNNDFSEALEKLVLEKRVVEIEYCLPVMSDRIKSFYLPKGTNFDITGIS